MGYAALCGMSENEFWDSTPRFLSAKLKAVESLQKLSWEQARFVAFFGSRAQGKSFQAFYKFEWERARFAQITQEELEQFSREADEVIRQIHAPKKDANERAIES